VISVIRRRVAIIVALVGAVVCAIGYLTHASHLLYGGFALVVAMFIVFKARQPSSR